MTGFDDTLDADQLRRPRIPGPPRMPRMLDRLPLPPEVLAALQPEVAVPDTTAADPVVEVRRVQAMVPAVPAVVRRPSGRLAPVQQAAGDPYLVYASRFMGLCAAAGLLGLLATWLTHF